MSGQLLVNFAGTEPAGTRPPFPPKGVWPAFIEKISPAKDGAGNVKGLWVFVQVDPSAGLPGKAGGAEYFGLDLSKQYNKEKLMKLVLVGSGYTKEQLQNAGTLDLNVLLPQIQTARRRIWIKTTPQARTERDEVTGQTKTYDDLSILTEAEAADERASIAAASAPVGASLGAAPNANVNANTAAPAGGLPPMGGASAAPVQGGGLSALPSMSGAASANGAASTGGLPPMGSTQAAMQSLLGS